MAGPNLKGHVPLFRPFIAGNFFATSVDQAVRIRCVVVLTMPDWERILLGGTKRFGDQSVLATAFRMTGLVRSWDRVPVGIWAAFEWAANDRHDCGGCAECPEEGVHGDSLRERRMHIFWTEIGHLSETHS